jgi:CsoR family transcriptional regulator, copper-sensing transcriptional repressor
MATDAAAPESVPGTDARRAMTEDDAKILNRLARIEGQVRGLQRMIEQGKDCEEILAQLAAAKSALERVGTHLISHHMKDCLEDTTGAQLDPAALERAFDVFFKYVQCMRS